MTSATPTPKFCRARMMMLAGGLLALAVAGGVWIVQRGDKPPSASAKGEVLSIQQGKRFGVTVKGAEDGKHEGMRKESGKRVSEDSASKASAGDADDSDGHRPPLQLMGLLASGKPTVDERVRQMRAMRGIVLSEDERAAALAFLSGKNVPEAMGKGSMHWLADELLTVLRLQEPPWEGLASELGKIAFQPGTDPVLRDYIMQHLGHLWEQFGAREEIEKSLWQAVATGDETTPGTALIALSRGYNRDQQRQSLGNVQQRAFTLAADTTTPLAVRVTALSIAGEGGAAAVKELAAILIKDPATPVILRKVAERVVR